MPNPMKTLLPIAIGAIALGIIVVGLAGGSATEPSQDERVEALAASIKCPFCNGESLADSPSSVAGDYRTIIADRVAAGATDQEVIDEFAASFGQSYIIGGSQSGWSFVLWALPVAIFIGGLFAIVGLKRASRFDNEVAS